MKIKDIDLAERVMVIAEIGNNHEGDFDLAASMIGLAKDAGADAVKFQTIIPDKLVDIKDKDRIQQLKRFQFSYDEFRKLSEIAAGKEIIFLSTPFDIESVSVLDPIVPAFKIASGDNNFFPMIEAVAVTGKPILLSTGLYDMDEVLGTIKYIEGVWNNNNIEQDIAVMHCVSSYPVALEEANLLAVSSLARETGRTSGYSDHTRGIEAAILSVALGARIIEKHFTIDRNYSSFPDHQLSADPVQFSEMVNRIREAEILLGTGEKMMQESEKISLNKIRRSIVAARDLAEGDVLSLDAFSYVRPGDGVTPDRVSELDGRKLNISLKKGDKILIEHICDEQ